jgi:hypothetical protein
MMKAEIAAPQVPLQSRYHEVYIGRARGTRTLTSLTWNRTITSVWMESEWETRYVSELA